MRCIILRGKDVYILMETPFASSIPAKLYALMLKLRLLEEGMLMPFSSE